jgi:hypothetical protein
MGVAKTLSTTIEAPTFRAMSQTAARSITSSVGLEGVSRKTHFVSGVIAFFQASRSEPSTRVERMPKRGRMLVMIW